MISGKKKENLGLLEVGTIDIPILSLPERQLPALGPYRVHPLLLLLFQVRRPKCSQLMLLSHWLSPLSP